MSTTRTKTEEGIDKQLAVQYYARWSFIHELLPALRSSAAAKEDAGVISVYGAGYGTDVDLDDLGLKKRSASSVVGPGAAYNDLMCEVSLFIPIENSHRNC
jgi:hypothetical protein